ncbi:hypothetical protein EDB86DRAFT_2913397 [Lactarius hatsudake]|nr:hypothetical protein EDB86DRAFT_2913397 [Lactarius hatsudake]
MREKVFLRLLLICFQGSTEDGLEIGGRGGRGRFLRHRNSSEKRRLRYDTTVAEGRRHGGARMIWQLTPAQPPPRG